MSYSLANALIPGFGNPPIHPVLRSGGVLGLVYISEGGGRGMGPDSRGEVMSSANITVHLCVCEFNKLTIFRNQSSVPLMDSMFFV